MHARLTSFFTLGFLIAALLIAAGCSNQNTQPENTASPSAAPEAASANQTESASAAGSRTVYPLVIDNYTLSSDGKEPKSKQQTFPKAPERVVANTQPVAELLIKLGLGDKLVGVAALYGDPDPEVPAEEFAKVPVLSEVYVSKEPVVSANPDLVIGRAELFADADWGHGTVESLNELGILTYVFNVSLPGATLDSLYRDIEEIGKIFDVQDKAAAHIESLKARLAALKEKYSGEPALKFAVIIDAGDGNLNAASGAYDTFQHEVLEHINLHNAFHDIDGWEASIEQLVAEKPDILLLMYYKGGSDPQTTMKAAYANPALQDIPAIQNKKIYVIDFNDFWGYTDQIIGAVEELAKEIYGR